jgi:hypothetical protein
MTHIIIIITVSVLALGPAQPPFHWVLGAVFPGVEQLEHEANHSTPSSPEVNSA